MLRENGKSEAECPVTAGGWQGRQQAGGFVLSLPQSTETQLATQTPAKSIFTGLSNREAVLAKLVSADTLKRDTTVKRSVTPSVPMMKR